MATPTDLEHARAVKRAHGAALMERYQASGLAIGRQDEEYVLVVYLPAPRPDLAAPVAIDGVRLTFEVTGRFRVQ